MKEVLFIFYESTLQASRRLTSWVKKGDSTGASLYFAYESKPSNNFNVSVS